MNKEAEINKELIKVLGEKIQLLEEQKVISQKIIDIQKEQLTLTDVVGRSEQLKAFVEWWHGLSQEELVWYEGRYVEVFESL